MVNLSGEITKHHKCITVMLVYYFQMYHFRTYLDDVETFTFFVHNVYPTFLD